METSIKNKIVWISNASSETGKATAALLLQKGHTVYAGAQRKENMEDLKQLGAHILRMDLTNDGDMQYGIDEIIANEGRIDILINSTDFDLLGGIEHLEIPEAKHQMDVNVFGLARLTQLALPYMKKQQSGKIINITSTVHKNSSVLSGWYNAGRAAIQALSHSTAKEVKPFGVDVVLMENNKKPKLLARLILKSITTKSHQAGFRWDDLIGIQPFFKKYSQVKQPEFYLQ